MTILCPNCSKITVSTANLVTDHQHYWEDGGATYHNRYNSYEFVRGQEGDLWKGHVEPKIDIPPNTRADNDPNAVDRGWVQDWINRSYMPQPEDQPQAQTFSLGLQFIRDNQAADNWFLQIETFDPHEPFFSQAEFKNLYPKSSTSRRPICPPLPSYKPLTESPEYVQYMRYQYTALLSMCDRYLGRLLDAMDEIRALGRYHAHRLHRPWLSLGRA